jgi:hypothetical protein
MKVVGAAPNSLERIEKEVRDAATEVGAMIVPTFLRVEAPLAAAIEADQFAALIRFLKPRLVYMMPIAFAAEEDALSQLEDEGDEEWLLSLPEVAALIGKWRRYDDQMVRLTMAVVADGVMHGATEDMPWGEEFTAAVDALRPALARARDTDSAERQAMLKKRIAGKVADLVGDPRFSAGKAGHAKRLVLARSLFAGLDDAELEDLVTEAENAFWLKTGKS